MDKTGLPVAVALALAREVLASGRPFVDRARGRSMTPLVPPGSELLVVPCPPSELAPGDVVLAAWPGGPLVAHRLLLVPRPGRRAVTKGDRTARADPPLPPDGILGRVEAVTRPDGRRLALRRPGWRILGLLAALASPWTGLALGMWRGLRGSRISRSYRGFNGDTAIF